MVSGLTTAEGCLIRASLCERDMCVCDVQIAALLVRRLVVSFTYFALVFDREQSFEVSE